MRAGMCVLTVCHTEIKTVTIVLFYSDKIKGVFSY